MTKTGRIQATPSAKRMLQRLKRRSAERLAKSLDEIVENVRSLISASHPQRVKSSITSRALQLAVNLAVAALVLSLPLAATAASQANAPLPRPTAESSATALMGEAGTATARAQLPSRGGSISAARSATTVQAAGVQPIHEYTLGKTDTLGSVANFYSVSPEAVAFANGITDPMNLEAGRVIRIPPGNGALYTVVEGDTVESVATRFKVETAVIMEYNRLYFEPEHFAPGQLIFVRGAELPALVYQTVDPEPNRPTVIARAPSSAPQAPQGTQPSASVGALGLPVNGLITQYFWAAHTGVDIATAYGTTIVAAASGTVSATGQVPVGGLRVCIRHAGGLETCYYHTGAVFVSPGQWVERGQGIASIGMTGVTTGPHVHWEAKLNGAFVNPLAYR